MSGTTTETEWVPVHRMVMPDEGDPSVWPLYADWGEAPSSAVSTRLDSAPDSDEMLLDLSVAQTAIAGMLQPKRRMPEDFSRHSVTVPAGERLSLSTYFNAFPAAYWQQWSRVTKVRLSLKLTGRGNVEVFRSNARGTFVKIAGSLVENDEYTVEVPLNRFGDGGWLWFDAVAGSGEVTVSDASWQVPVPAGQTTPQTQVTIASTTFNMPDDCVAQMRRLAAHPDVMKRVREFLIIDQGTKHVSDAEGFSEAAADLGDKFRVIRQGNFGGSGGFSRGMLESLDDDGSSGVLLLDDDAVVEPEGILRALQFEDFARKPLIVGGHMFNRNERTILHSLGERVNSYKFWWDSVSPEVRDIDFAQQRIRTSPVLNRRVDAEYNGWWMCLIPREVMEKIGLSLPFFIKWDDAEYGLRAEEAGFPTVSLPGAAVWHVPWTEKDDGLDWQAYFHQRNRLIAALLHSPYKYGGMLPRVSFATDVKHLLSLQYTPEHLRLLALRDVLQGPEHFAKTAIRRAADARRISKEGQDSKLIVSPGEYPEVKRDKPLKKGELPKAPDGRRAFAIKALAGVIRQLRPTEKGAARNPEIQISNHAARWWMLANVDSALVSNAAGSGVWWYRRDRRSYTLGLRDSVSLYLRLATRWAELSSEYTSALTALVSPESWRQWLHSA